MKFHPASTIAVVLAALSSSAHAQGVAIGYPPDGFSVKPGHKYHVEVDRPNTLSGSTEVAVVLGLQSCVSTCHSVADGGVGTVLYNGKYNPQYASNAAFKPPHQNLTIEIPSTFAQGPAQLGLVHVSLIGAGLAPFLQTMNITLNVV